MPKSADATIRDDASNLLFIKVRAIILVLNCMAESLRGVG